MEVKQLKYVEKKPEDKISFEKEKIKSKIAELKLQQEQWIANANLVTGRILALEELLNPIVENKDEEKKEKTIQ